ncbi:DUF817 family protein [Microbacterium sp. NPDC089180]|uniref:DUF817 family protein n=1 Tax=unclassified Microbacterium TaxID=2609290 RepID=UPI003419B969
MPDRRSFTPVEARIDAVANRLLAGAPTSGARARAVEFAVFVLKQAWACVFGAAFLVVVLAAKLWLAENIATYAGAWLYPSQVGGWHPVDASKLSSWFLLMIVSVVLVTWVYPPRRPDAEEPTPQGSTGHPVDM